MSDDPLLPPEHAEAIASLLRLLRALLRHYQPSDELYAVVGEALGHRGWGRLLLAENPVGIWVLMEHVRILEGWLHVEANRERFPAGARPRPPLPPLVLESLQRIRAGVGEDPPAPDLRAAFDWPRAFRTGNIVRHRTDGRVGVVVGVVDCSDDSPPRYEVQVDSVKDGRHCGVVQWMPWDAVPTKDESVVAQIRAAGIPLEE